MPTSQWLENNPKVSAHIPQPLYEKLEAFMRDRNLQKTAQAVTLILTEYLSSPQLSTQSSPQLLTVVQSNPLKVVQSCSQLSTDESLEEFIKQQVERVLQSREVVRSSPHQGQKEVSLFEVKRPKVDNSCSQLSTDKQQWLTTGEAYAEAWDLGYRKSKTTFRRAFARGLMPPELERLGLIANWHIRSECNLKDNSVRWLRFES
jgi:hypothetical protein